MATTGAVLRPDIVIDPPVDGHVVVHDRLYNKYYRLGEREAAFVANLSQDGASSDLNQEQRQAIMQWLEAKGMLEGSDATLSESMARNRGWRGFLRNPIAWRGTLLRPDAFLDRNRAGVDAMFSRPAVAIYLLLFLSPIITALVAPQSLTQALDSFDTGMRPFEWALIYLTVVISTSLHEFAHAIACKHYGGRVEKIGVMLFYLLPVAYCDVSDSWRFKRTESKVLVSAAGIFFELTFASLCLAVWMLTYSTVFGYLGLIHIVMSMVNMCPFVKLDGYWILVHILKEPHLRRRSMEAIKRFVFRHKDRSSEERMLYFWFGVVHLTFVPVFWLLGLSAVFRYLSYLSSWAAWAACTLIVVLTARRLLKAYRHRHDDVGREGAGGSLTARPQAAVE